MFVSSTPLSSSNSSTHWRLNALISLGLLLLFLVWDFSGGDMAMARLWGDSTGFPLREHGWMVKVMHQGARTLGWLFLIAMLLGVWRPWGPLRSLATAERAGIFLGVLCALLAVILVKGFSQTSCPWDLQAFGGLVPYVSHWDIGQADGGGGHCFPAGHASTGFAFMAAFFGLQQSAPRAALKWLGWAVLVGFILGISQQVRGAHFMSHTLWTSWLCWTVGWIGHLVFCKLRLKVRAY